jgi:phospholipid/cholesterol/gamma-HCH transport system substrate-binding protein
MKFTSSQKIGFFVLLVIAAIFFTINFLRGHDLFKKNYKYYTYLDDVQGLSATGPVYIRGLKVGTVESINFAPQKDSFLVKLSIKNDYAIPIDSRAEIYSSDILGAKSLRIGLGTAGIHAKDGDTLKGSTIPDMMSLLYKSVGPLKDQVYALIGNLNKTLDNINLILDSNARYNLQGSFAKLNGTLANAEQLSASLNTMTPDLSSAIKNVNDLTYTLNDPHGNLSSTLVNINKTSQQLSELQLKESIDQLNKLLKQLQDPNATLGKLMTTDELHNSMDSLMREVDDLVKKIKENPKKYIRVTVF